MELTQAQLQEMLHYDPETGIFTWKVDRTGTAKSGEIAGSYYGEGYRRVKIGGKSWAAHRLAWLYMYGHIPDVLDHKNRVRDDNRIANLREATVQQNCHNRSPSKAKTQSGYAGVFPSGTGKRWRSRIRNDGKAIHLGTFDTPEQAHVAYLAAKAIYHPFAYT